MRFEGRHGPFDPQPPQDIAAECDDCDAVLTDVKGRMWLGKWVAGD